MYELREDFSAGFIIRGTKTEAVEDILSNKRYRDIVGGHCWRVYILWCNTNGVSSSECLKKISTYNSNKGNFKMFGLKHLACSQSQFEKLTIFHAPELFFFLAFFFIAFFFYFWCYKLHPFIFLGAFAVFIQSCVSLTALECNSLCHNPVFFEIVLHKLFRLYSFCITTNVLQRKLQGWSQLYATAQFLSKSKMQSARVLSCLKAALLFKTQMHFYRSARR